MNESDRFRGDGLIRSLKVELRPLGAVRPAKRNARTHSERQIGQIASSIRQFGFTNPIIVDEEGMIVAGHGRHAAAALLGLADVPVISIIDLDPAELRAYALADNRIAQNAGWDEDVLRIEFEELHALELAFDLEITGFSTTEIDQISAMTPTDAKLEKMPAVDRRQTCAVERGDLWILGHHRLLCGDTRRPESFAQLMGDDRARLVFSDPPFNVKINGHVGGLGKTKHAEFAMATGEMSEREFTGFLETAFRNAADVSMDGAIHYQCMDWRHVEEMMMAGRAVYSELKNICIWSKDNAGMGSFYRSQHELVFVWKVGTAPHLNTVELGKNGRYRTNIWNYRAATRTGADAELAMHPTVKPVTMVMDAIKDTSKRGEIVLDPFGGSGSTLIAAEKTKRHGRLIEYEPGYCEVTIRRWQALTRRAAILDSTGESFAEVSARRIAAMEGMADAALNSSAGAMAEGSMNHDDCA
ncbi:MULTISPECIES: site-specific DNA-methyltransferase [unclassified Sphingobium]|uniref:site-specific DNA-methyltransferase n=1 Tax=unclassified Sphingobium TaxID=2611147 RepID=UPI000D17E38C|nr:MULTISPECIES: DNA methyltransferase [unclassified Sphingobium]MBG6119029.1 DNA modification methylase [Sphingobium sp. JAI105]PSO10640.1 DNA methylase N-4 [Sphingobium sp. AEW4]TWD02115.1 DNA modification methylase [Sphingobium sp. AEW010]TWD20634.1 DNA modification methylase [Sphingobium sp. AEW013]TWD23362.1 DNA modification methylase [Sphingobium sp. AEW001]